MNEGGILFGVDNEGNPLIADGGEEPIMTGMNYGDTRNAVYLKDPKREWTDDNMTGYEMFPYVQGKNEYQHEKSPEIKAFERFTGKPFVVALNKRECRDSWLESGKNPVWPCYINLDFDPGRRDFDLSKESVRRDIPENHSPWRGVRRLLRLKAS